MMTFVLDKDFKITASLLDSQRLGKQRVEAYQIITTITSPTGNGWSNHPVMLMWKDHLIALKYYYNCMVNEWVKRGYNNNMPLYDLKNKLIILPWWVYWDKLIYSHQMMLVRKNPKYYASLFTIPEIYKEYGYIWAGELSPNDKDLELNVVASPIPEHLLNAKYCQCITKKGSICNIVLKKGQEKCGVHKNISSK